MPGFAPAAVGAASGLRFGRKPTRSATLDIREVARQASLADAFEQKKPEPLFNALEDQALTVSLTAYKLLRQLVPLTYSSQDKRRYTKALAMGDAALSQYGNGMRTAEAAEELKKEGYRLIYGDDRFPRRLLTQEMLDTFDYDDHEIGEIREGNLVLTAKAVMGKTHRGMFLEPKPNRPGYFLFSENKRRLTRETFWHEYFHYLQHQVRLPNSVPRYAKSYYLRELECNQFILDHREQLKLTDAAVRQELRLWQENLYGALLCERGWKKAVLGLMGVDVSRLKRAASK